jgi:hypothetical protein
MHIPCLWDVVAAGGVGHLLLEHVEHLTNRGNGLVRVSHVDFPHAKNRRIFVAMTWALNGGRLRLRHCAL